MRDYGIVRPSFWTGETGRSLRAMGSDEMLVAMYLITGPNANMIGLYHMPLILMSHHTGIPLEGACKALRRVCEAGFARFDDVAEEVFVVEMAAHQIGEPLDPRDKRKLGIEREWLARSKSRFFMDFYKRYSESFLLPKPPKMRAGARGLQGAYKPHRSQDQEQEQEQEQDSKFCPDPAEPGSGPAAAKTLWGDKPIQFDPDAAAWVGIRDRDRQTWAKAYPAVNMDSELAAMAAWIIANPQKGRKKNYGRFITSWLSRSQDRVGPTRGEINGHQGRPSPSRVAAPSGKYAGVGATVGGPDAGRPAEP